MTVTGTPAETAPVKPAARSDSSKALIPAAVVALTLVGLLLRIPSLGDSLFGDELSSYFVVTARSLHGTLHLLNGKAIELNPPLFFVLAWVSEKLGGDSQQALRFISVLAGTAAIPLTYALGRLTVGWRAALPAAALVTLSPFLIFFSSEARAYSLVMTLGLASSVGLLMALRTGRRTWWLFYAAASCAAMYTHYTSLFLLAAQFAWAFWTHPRARRMLIGANALAALVFAPWLPYLINTTHSPGRALIGALQPFGPHAIRLALETWSIGHPLLSLSVVPGTAAVVMILAGTALALAALAPKLARGRRWPTATDVLPLILMLAAPVGVGLYSALGTSEWDNRDLISSWPGFAVTLGALVASAITSTRTTTGTGESFGLPISRRSRLALTSLPAALVMAGFAVGTVLTLERSHRRPNYDAAARFIVSAGAPSDPVVDLGALTPGPPNETEAALALNGGRAHPVVRLGQPPLASVLGAPPYTSLPPQPGDVVAREAVRLAAHGRLFFVLAGYAPITAIQALRGTPPHHVNQGALGLLAAFLHALPSGFNVSALRTYNGLVPVTVYEFARPGA